MRSYASADPRALMRGAGATDIPRQPRLEAGTAQLVDDADLVEEPEVKWQVRRRRVRSRGRARLGAEHRPPLRDAGNGPRRRRLPLAAALFFAVKRGRPTSCLPPPIESRRRRTRNTPVERLRGCGPGDIWSDGPTWPAGAAGFFRGRSPDSGPDGAGRGDAAVPELLAAKRRCRLCGSFHRPRGRRGARDDAAARTALPDRRWCGGKAARGRRSRRERCGFL